VKLADALSRLVARFRRVEVEDAGHGRYDKWRRWLDGVADGETNGKITNEIIAMHARRVPWREITRLANNRRLPSPESYWWEYVLDTYVVTQSIAIRRQLDQGPNAVSLGRMLREMADHPGAVTRALWVELWDGEDEHNLWLANKQWDENFAGPDDPDTLNPELPAADLRALTEGGKTMRDYVNRHIAHIDRRGSKTLPLLSDIDDAIDLIASVFDRYFGLLTAGSHTQLEPVFQGDWAAPLRTAWLPPMGRH
jgi:hypothetical protein